MTVPARISPAAFCVGVAGHRPNRLLRSDPPVLARQIELVLQTVCDSVPGRLCIVSSLAEGADRLVAHAALQLGYALRVPLPLPRGEYENDFPTEASKAEFRALLLLAEAVFEPETSGPDRPQAYGAAGETMLTQCDLLLAVWDGKPAAGPGGTVAVIERAVALVRPVVRIDAVAPHAISCQNVPDPLAVPAAAILALFAESA